jgi:hypothetical protein
MNLNAAPRPSEQEEAMELDGSTTAASEASLFCFLSEQNRTADRTNLSKDN